MFSAENSSSENKIFGGINNLGETLSVRLHQMKPIRKPKYGKWLLIALLVFLIGMFGLLFVPAPIEGVFVYHDEAEMLLGAPTYHVFKNGKVGRINSAVIETDKLVGEYEQMGGGSVKVTSFHPTDKPGLRTLYHIKSRLFSIHFPKYRNMPRPWGRRLFSWEEDQTWIRKLEFVRFTNTSDGTPAKETYNSELVLVSTELNPKDFPPHQSDRDAE